jgi:hypothetical protein
MVMGSEACEVAVTAIVALGGDTEPLVNFGGSIDRLTDIDGGLDVSSDILQNSGKKVSEKSGFNLNKGWF